jgi:hypothetical protein
MPTWGTVNGGYGDEATAEYFADAFAYTLYDRGKLPSDQVGIEIDALLLFQAGNLP